MKYLLFLALALVCANCAAKDVAAASPQSSSSADHAIRFSGGDGSSIEQAIVIENAEGERDGVAAEYAWVRDKFPGFKFEGQGIVTKDPKVYDRLEGTTAEGKKAEFYFDITLFFGKF